MSSIPAAATALKERFAGTVAAAAVPAESFIKNEGCDSCGYSSLDADRPEGTKPRRAQAYMAFVFPSGSVLYFCAHHGNEYKMSPNLVTSGVKIVDETDRINKAPSVSANKD